MHGSSLFLKRRLRVVFVWSVLFSCGRLLLPDAAAQGGATATVVGTVHDAAGAVIPGAEIVITQTDTGFSRTAMSAEDGSFAFPVLPLGPYRLEVKMVGFALYRQTGIVLTVNQVAKVPVSLQLKQIAESVSVTAETSAVDTTTGQISYLVDQRQVVDLPLNGRNPAELLLLAPGVTNPGLNSANPNHRLQFSYPVSLSGASAANVVSNPQQGLLSPTVNGLRGGSVYFSLDGANNMDSYGVTGGPFPNPDAVQEFRVLTSGYGAEYVSAPGGAVNVVTKSGTNEFHGNLFEFHRNGALNARNFFAAKSDNIKRNQFGATAGGPIVKNELFIFGSYQGTILRDTVGGNIQFVPTDAQRAGDFSSTANQLKNPFTGAPYVGNRIPLADFNPVTSKLLALLPRSSAADGRIEVVQPLSQTEHQFVTKADYVVSKHSFVTRYFFADFKQPGIDGSKNLLLLSGGNRTFRWQDAMVGHNYAAGKWVNESRFTFQRHLLRSFHGVKESFKDLGANVTEGPGIQQIQVAGFFQVLGGNVNRFPRETFTLSERLNVIQGRHQLSLGAEVSRLRITETHNSGQGGAATWAPQNPAQPFTSGNIISDFLFGKVTQFVQSDGGLVRVRGTLWGFYGTDQIRATSRLTLTLGLRWDPYWPFHSLAGRMACFRPGQQSTVFINAPLGAVYPGDPGCNASGGIEPDLHTFQPRIGFAYSLNRKGSTSIRGGYGLYTMQFPMQSFIPFATQQPYARSITRPIPPSLSDPWGGFPGGNPFAGGFLLDDLPRPVDAAFRPPLSLPSFEPDFKLASVQQWNLTLEHLLKGTIVVRASYVGTKGTHLSVGVEGNPAVFIAGQCESAPCSTTANTDARRRVANVASAPRTLGAANSIYHALQLGVERRLSGGFHIASNYTWGKSLDTVSQNAGPFRGPFNTVPNPYDLGAFRGLSDFDLSHSLATSFVWQLPSFKNDSFFVRHLLSRWQTSGVWIWQVGQPFGVFSGLDNSLSGVGLDLADLVSGVSPILDPDRPRGELVNRYFNIAAFQANALGTFGNSGRNILRGPGYMNLDLAVMKTFPVKEKYGVTFRAEFFNLPNIPQFMAPANSRSSPQIGRILRARDPRILQFALKFNW